MKPAFNFVPLLKGLTKVLGGIGGVSFLVGGGLIHAESQLDRSTAELVGIGIAGGCLILVLLVNELAERIIHRQDNPRESSD